MKEFTWYLPSVYGDITLQKVTAQTTRLTLVGLAPTEKEAVKALLERSVRPGVLQDLWLSPSEASEIELGSLKEQQLVLRAPITKVQEFLQKKLKPHRKQVSAIRFTSGRMEELNEALLKVIDSPAQEDSPASTAVASSDNGRHPASPAKKPKGEKPERAVSVAVPVIGCPAPDFDDVEVRANRVLMAFLSPEQVDDFKERQQFVATGADTGHRYLLTSRSSRRALRISAGRSLYDLDEDIALCVHDWEVPPAEELLGIFVHLSLPGLETYVRGMPDRDGILHG